MREYLTLKDFFKKYKWNYIMGAIALVTLDIILAYIPRLIGIITDGLKSKAFDFHILSNYAIEVVALAFIVLVLRYFWRIGFMGAARHFEYEMRNKFFSHLLSMSPDYFNHHKTGELMAYATNDIQAVRNSLAGGVTQLMDTIVLFVTSLTIVLRTIDIKLTLIALIPGPFLFAVMYVFGGRIRNFFRRVQEAYAYMTDRAEENMNGIRVVKSYVQEKWEVEKFNKANQANFDTNLAMAKLTSVFGPTMQILSAISSVIVIIYGGRMVIKNQMTLGNFVSFYTYLGTLLGPLTTFGNVINIFQRGSASLKRINDMLRVKPQITDRPDAVELDNFTGKIEIKDLTFKYKSDLEPALSDINVTVNPGETLAIIGRTGSGKSTLANLLLHLYKIPDGKIFFDGVDINKIKLSSLRQNIGYVPQEIFLFSSSIKENIAFTENNVSDEEVQSVANLANIHNEILEFADGYETILGERGVTLSGGQKQRLSIARALIKNPSILVLDDCLSAVDTQTENIILKNLKEYMKNRTSIVISHRVSAIKDADHIIVLDDGKITESGNHEYLMSFDSFYKGLYEKQQLEENLNEEE